MQRPHLAKIKIWVELKDKSRKANTDYEQLNLFNQISFIPYISNIRGVAKLCVGLRMLNVSLRWLEKVRNDLRDLVKFLVGQDGQWFKVDIEDTISDEGIKEGITPRMSYKQSVLEFLSNNRNLPVLRKIYNLEQLTTADIVELERILWKELGSKADYDRYTEGMVCGSNVAIFIRSMVGVDRKNAVRRFSEFISGHELNAEQEDFLMTIITYVCENGDITKEIVVNEPPFDERLSVFTPYMLPLAKYIDNIHSVVMSNAG